MALANCKQCGALFLQVKSAYCVECENKYNEYYMQIRDYLKKHPQSTIWDLHEELGISLSILQYLLKNDDF